MLLVIGRGLVLLVGVIEFEQLVETILDVLVEIQVNHVEVL